MVGRRDYDAQVIAFAWDFRPTGNVRHIAEHGVRPEDVEEVHELAPRFFRNTQAYNATHLMVGSNRDGRYLRAAIIETPEPGIWIVATAHWLTQRRGERMYEAK